MLVLSRKKEEKIRIGKDIVITIVEVRCGVVRLGIDAPKEIPIKRIELDSQGKEIPVPQRDNVHPSLPLSTIID